jgi:hypothetical protein
MTEVANLDPEKFKNISEPFEGETEEEFLKYLDLLYFDDIYEELDEETQIEMSKIYEPEWTEYSNSTWKGEDSWLESGRVDETWTKTGGFEVNFDTSPDY